MNFILIEEKYDRQIRFFTDKGQNELRQSKVTIVGAGGLGSHLIQQLSYLGVGLISVVDDDVVDVSNLNRLIGANIEDIRVRNSKVEVAKRTSKSINKEIDFLALNCKLQSEQAFNSIINSDYVFGCIDNDGPRQVLLELAMTRRIPYFDLATQILIDDTLTYGGRVFFSSHGNGCLACLEILDQTEIQDYFLNKNAIRDKNDIYGIEMSNDDRISPSVVTLNGVISSLASTEFMLHVTGIRKANRSLIYRANRGVVNLVNDEPAPDCYYCNSSFRPDITGIQNKYFN